MWMQTSVNIRYCTIGDKRGSGQIYRMYTEQFFVCFVVKCACLVTEDAASEEEQPEEDFAGW